MHKPGAHSGRGGNHLGRGGYVVSAATGERAVYTPDRGLHSGLDCDGGRWGMYMDFPVSAAAHTFTDPSASIANAGPQRLVLAGYYTDAEDILR